MKKFIKQLAKIYKNDNWEWGYKNAKIPDELDIACAVIDRLKTLLEQKVVESASGGIRCTNYKDEGVRIVFEKEYLSED